MTREEMWKEFEKQLIRETRTPITVSYDVSEKMTKSAIERTVAKWKERLEQEPKTWSLDDAREDFMSDVYNTLDFLPTNDEANRIIDSFDRVTSNIRQEPVLDKIRAEIEEQKQMECFDSYDEMFAYRTGLENAIDIIDKYKAEQEK